MRTEQLEYVAAIARLGSFRRAAEELHISQPALSATVRNLERELGVEILERGREGARVSGVGGELLPHIAAVIDAVDGLRRAANEHHHIRRMIRLGTVNAGTVPLLTPVIAEFRDAHTSTQVEVVGAQEADIDRGLREGSFDLGLITCLAADVMPPELETTRLLSGRVVVCIRNDSPLAGSAEISNDQMLSVPLIVMRAGYLMHRVLFRLLDGRQPSVSYSTDGAEMGKLMVAEGLGATVLPDFSVVGDPLERSGVITWRRIAGDDTEVRLAIRRRHSESRSPAARDLYRMFLNRAASYETGAAAKSRGSRRRSPATARRRPEDRRSLKPADHRP